MTAIKTPSLDRLALAKRACTRRVDITSQSSGSFLKKDNYATDPNALVWGLSDWRDKEAYLPESAPLEIWAWEFWRRSKAARIGWQSWNAGRYEKQVKFLRSSDDLQNAAASEIAPLDIGKSGWWWSGQNQRRCCEYSGIFSRQLGVKKICWDAVLDSFSSAGPIGPSDSRHTMQWRFDLTAPIEGQLEQVQALLKRRQAELIKKKEVIDTEHSKNNRSRAKWQLYLRLLDARDLRAPPTWGYIETELDLSADQRKQSYEAAKELRDNPKKLRFIKQSVALKSSRVAERVNPKKG